MAIEFKRMILKLSDIEGEVATVPSTNDHTDGSWLTTDIYVGELFLNIVDNILQTRTESGIETLITAGGGVAWGAITGTLSSQTDLNSALNSKIEAGDNISILVNDAGYLVANAVDSVNGQTGVVVLTKADVDLSNVDNTSDSDKPVSTAQQTEIDTKQDSLVSGTNIKTINGNSILGSGNLAITAGATTFLGLTDTPSVFTGAGEYFVKVKEDLTGLEFVEKEDDTLISTITIGTSRDFIITDKNKNIQNDGEATLTMRDNGTVPFPVGTQIYLTKAYGADFDIAAGAGVTINSVGGALKLREQWSGAVLLQTSIDVWNFNGDIEV